MLTTISNGSSIIKMLIEPRQIKKVSNATNDSIKKAKQIVDSIDEPAYILSHEFFVCNKHYSQMMRNYGCPESLLGVYQLNNIIKIITGEKIDKSLINEKEIDCEILSNIMDRIRFVSDETLSKAWSKLLKNEVECKHKYSMRTIELLSQLSPEEANLFDKKSKSIIHADGNFFLLYNENTGNGLLERAILMEAGFISFEPLTITDGKFLWNGYYIITEGKVNVFKLTKFGTDIYQLIENDISVNDCKDELDSQKELISWSIHKMINETQYETIPILNKS